MEQDAQDVMEHRTLELVEQARAGSESVRRHGFYRVRTEDGWTIAKWFFYGWEMPTPEGLTAEEPPVLEIDETRIPMPDDAPSTDFPSVLRAAVGDE